MEFPGVISAAFAVGLGASGGSLVQWRTDRGLWMLAGLFLLILLINCAIYGVITFGQLNDIVRGAPKTDVGLVVDFTVATTILTATISFLTRVARYNWIISRHPATPDRHDRRASPSPWCNHRGPW